MLQYRRIRTTKGCLTYSSQAELIGLIGRLLRTTWLKQNDRATESYSRTRQSVMAEKEMHFLHVTPTTHPNQRSLCGPYPSQLRF